MTELEVGKEYWIKAEFLGEGSELPCGPFIPEKRYAFRIGKRKTPTSVDLTLTNFELIEAIPEREKVTIPKEVAEWIEFCKAENKSLFDSMAKLDLTQPFEEAIDDWFSEFERERQEIFARAWLDGYKVEKELLYWVRDKRDDPILLKWSTGGITTGASSVDKATQRKHKEIYTFTEKEIKDYDERYWPFAVPVEEDDE